MVQRIVVKAERCEMSRKVVFEEFGSIDRLQVKEVHEPHPGAGEVRVRVVYAGLNPVDWKIIQAGPGVFGATIPSGNGNDFAGIVDEAGTGSGRFALGTPVYGGSRFFAQADYVIVDENTLHPVPAGLGLGQAGSLDIAAKTAVAGVRVLALTPGETVFVSAAAGGVGVLAAQLARSAGARVIGSASPANHDFLRRLGIEPVAYGDGLSDRLRSMAPKGIAAAFSTQHADELEMLIGLGVRADRINAIGAGPAAATFGVHTDGAAKAHAGDLEAVANAIAGGEIVLPIDSVFPLDDVVSAYRHLMAGHLRGKVLLRTVDGLGAGDPLAR